MLRFFEKASVRDMVFAFLGSWSCAVDGLDGTSRDVTMTVTELEKNCSTF
jgi:hypothetical protein